MKLKNTFAWVFFSKLAAYFQKSVLEEYLKELLGILFFYLFLMLLLFIIILHCRPLLIEKVKRHVQKQF